MYCLVLLKTSQTQIKNYNQNEDYHHSSEKKIEMTHLNKQPTNVKTSVNLEK